MQLAAIIQALEQLPRDEVQRWLLGSICVLAIETETDPRELVEGLHEAFADEWESIRSAILVSQFERQMSGAGGGSAMAAPLT